MKEENVCRPQGSFDLRDKRGSEINDTVVTIQFVVGFD